MERTPRVKVLYGFERVETDDLTEIDVVNVREGAKVTISVDALPGQEFEGKVVRIIEKGGDVIPKIVRVLPERRPAGTVALPLPTHCPVCGSDIERPEDEAIARANDTEYGLTGGVYSQDKARLARAREDFHVGNLYLNRKITGAMVGAHPFGGFNMSGTDSKAGGPDYLYQFTQAKSIAEKLA